MTNIIEDKHHSLTVPWDMYHLQPAAGKAVRVEALLQKEQIKELSIGLKDASDCQDVSSGSKVSSPSATPKQNSKGTTISK